MPIRISFIGRSTPGDGKITSRNLKRRMDGCPHTMKNPLRSRTFSEQPCSSLSHVARTSIGTFFTPTSIIYPHWTHRSSKRKSNKPSTTYRVIEPQDQTDSRDYS